MTEQYFSTKGKRDGCIIAYSPTDIGVHFCDARYIAEEEAFEEEAFEEEAFEEEAHPKILSKEESLKALRDGHKLFCKNWYDDGFIFIFMKDVKILDETNREYSDGEFNNILNESRLYL